VSDATLDQLRQDALQKRINGVAGGLRVAWSTRDIARLADHIRSAPAEKILRDVPAVARKRVPNIAAARKKFSVVVRDVQADDRSFAFVISSQIADLAGDIITVAGLDFSDFLRNPAVLNSHDSSSMPIAVSTRPALAGTSLTAIAKFPEPGISDASDQVAAALGAELVKGASIGFVPVKWSFTKDPARPFGVDFEQSRLLEWSVCAVPCNPDCLMLGAVALGKFARRSSQGADDVPDDGSNWQCNASGALPLDISDDPFDAAVAKSALIKHCSPQGMISDQAADYFLATDVSAPWDEGSYSFPFCRVTNAGVVAAKVGWRLSLAEMEKSNIANLPLTDARAVCDGLEDRLGQAIATEARRREARALAAKARSLAASIGDDMPLTREQRLAEARNFRRAVMDLNRGD
jgi:hypothetical protein